MNNDNRYSSHSHHDYDDMDNLKHKYGITDEHGDHMDQHQEHH
ncbi:ATPase, partial [Streptococcus suis]|nr:ATPase [Streptococcus suis]